MASINVHINDVYIFKKKTKTGDFYRRLRLCLKGAYKRAIFHRIYAFGFFIACADNLGVNIGVTMSWKIQFYN